MTVIPLIIMVLLLIAALERNHRRQPPTPPGLHGSNDPDDRDWARITLDLLALGERADIMPRKPSALKHSRPAPFSGPRRARSARRLGMGPLSGSTGQDQGAPQHTIQSVVTTERRISTPSRETNDDR